MNSRKSPDDEPVSASRTESPSVSHRGSPAAHRVTLFDVARHAGFSRSTASLVFQESSLVAESTRRRVLAAAEELGYVYNRRAASLRMQRSNTVGLLIAGLSNPFFADLVDGVEEELRPSRYNVLFGNTLDEPDRQAALIRTLLEYRVDGLLLVPAIGSTSDLVAPVENLRVPFVVLTRRVAGLMSNYVGSDDVRGGQLAAQHLLDHGCKSLAYFGGPTEARSRAERERGFLEVVARNGARVCTAWSLGTKTSSTAGYKATERLLAEHPPPEGITCHSDALAFGLMRALRDAGLKVGHDVRVIGFDDVEDARHWSPSLSSISVSPRRMGREAARMLLESIENPDGSLRELTLDAALEIRESCGVEPVLIS